MFAGSMKRLFLSALAAGLLTGCAHRYDMQLTNGVLISNVSKPVLDRQNGVYIYKDVAGNKRYVSAGRVTEIGPHKRGSEFNSSDAR